MSISVIRHLILFQLCILSVSVYSKPYIGKIDNVSNCKIKIISECNVSIDNNIPNKLSCGVKTIVDHQIDGKIIESVGLVNKINLFHKGHDDSPFSESLFNNDPLMNKINYLYLQGRNYGVMKVGYIDSISSYNQYAILNPDKINSYNNPISFSYFSHKNGAGFRLGMKFPLEFKSQEPLEALFSFENSDIAIESIMKLKLDHLSPKYLAGDNSTIKFKINDKYWIRGGLYFEIDGVNNWNLNRSIGLIMQTDNIKYYADLVYNQQIKGLQAIREMRLSDSSVINIGMGLGVQDRMLKVTAIIFNLKLVQYDQFLNNNSLPLCII